MYCGCPLIWFSKLQKEIALSTTESEYIDLSQSMREVILILNMINEIAPIFGTIQSATKMRCRLFEDNEICLALAKAPRMNPRTKYIRLKYHHCRSFVASPATNVELIPIRTADKTADIFTKPLPDKQFEVL